MKAQSFETRVAAIVDAVNKASPTDSSIGIRRKGKGDGIDLLVDAVDGLLRRSRESVTAFHVAKEAMLNLQVARGNGAAADLSGDRALLLRALEENIPDTIYFKDKQSRFLHVSRAHLRAFNLKDYGDAIGKTDFDFFRAEHAREAFEDEQEIIRTGKPIINKEERELWPDRPDTWVLSTKMPLRDRQGAIVGTFGISRDITDRKRAEEALQKSEQRYRLLFNSINDAVFVHALTPEGLPGRISDVNDIACERLGYTRDELLQMSPLDFDAPEGAAIAPKMMVVLQEKKHAVWEGIHVTKAGLRIPVEISNHLFEMAGKPTILSNVRDITGRKRLEGDLERERLLLLTLINNLPDYVSVKDAESRFLLTNTANARVIGVQDVRDLVGKTDLDFYPPAEAAGYLADERAVIQTGNALINKEEASFDAEGRRRWTLTSKLPLVDSLGRVVGVVCTGRNITERKEAEERIQDLARFPDENPNPVIRVSLDGSLLYANPASRSLLASWTGEPMQKIPVEHMQELLQTWHAGEKRNIEVHEGKRVFELTIAPIRSRGYIDLYGRDVTEERSLAEKFLQSQKMEAVGRLAGGIAHDFNNLLTVIGGYCAIVQEELPRDSTVRIQIDEIARAARQAGSLTTQLLAFSRKQVLVPRVINPNDLLKSLENILARLVGEDVELMTFLPPETGNIKADPVQIEQVMMNLVVNARDAMPDGGKLTIETSNRFLSDEYASDHPWMKSGEYVRITVSDTGQGMDQEVLLHIFEPFFTTKKQGKGTGLGLSTVYGIVKQSGGHITSYSEVGKGTIFSIYFPRTDEAPDHTAVPKADIATLHGSETILLVEDEESVRKFTKTLLENNGYTVIGASGGTEALATMESQKSKVALLVTDVVMPQMSGKDLAQRLLLAYPGIRVLYLSGYTGNAIVHHGMLDPGIDFIQKPFNSHELLAKIREILSRKSSEA
jgi:PAS domain S-box-containing protein